MKKGNALLSLFVFALIGAFALLALVAVLVGGRVFRSVEQRSEANTGVRTTSAYIAGKVRAFDREGGVFVSVEDGVSVLHLTKEVEGSRYVTYIYCLDGALREYYQREGRVFVPENGEPIAEAEAVSFALADGGLTVTVRQQGADTALFLALRAGGAA